MLNSNIEDSLLARPGPAVIVGRSGDLRPWLWLWFPLLWLLAILLALNLDPDFYVRWFLYEDGLVEIGTAVLALTATVAGGLALRHRRRLPTRWLAGWLLAVTAACFYFGMEEISWGQKVFQWDTPEWIAAFNDQGETNLHNTSGLFDQLPRNLLMLWVIAGGIVAPILARIRGKALEPPMFWPTYVCLPTAVLAIATRTPDYLSWLSLPFSIRIDSGEVKEFYYALFLLLYLLSFWVRLRRTR